MVGRSEVVARLEGVERMVKVRLAVHGLGRARGREVERHFALAGIGVARRGLEEICAAEVSRGGRGGGEDGGERSGGRESRRRRQGTSSTRSEMGNIYATYRSLIGDREMPR